MNGQVGVRDPWSALSEAERQVARLIVEGLTNPEIAKRLVLSEDGVKSRVSKLLTTWRVRNRAELVSRLAERDMVAVATVVAALSATSLDAGQRVLVDQLRRLVGGRSR